ncbi:hypothetical protein [Hoeflea poritis]|uniref:Hedgehog/Intein (Hint) domain-containing protein n=1 Tax=Hoeflea poritis TaxID=2993659 RepID=A0ABT4VTT6_9HYPH|nr:hypothetical protein [Hoeflea poritis]MDA4847605.1 hypothetical protein [Hoeflea poritis]
MPLQNRVTPFGELVRTPARGTMMGNRGGRIHDNQSRTLLRRRWASRRWIVCVTEFRGRKRTLMQPNSYTELFFLDEATALAAGHRPCFECRHRDAKAFAAAFFGGSQFDKSGADAMDAILHKERCLSGAGAVVLTREEALSLPRGAIFAAGDDCIAVGEDTLLLWDLVGYRRLGSSRLDTGNALRLLTPPSTVAALRAGYRAQLHPSADA